MPYKVTLTMRAESEQLTEYLKTINFISCVSTVSPIRARLIPRNTKYLVTFNVPLITHLLPSEQSRNKKTYHGKNISAEILI